MLKFLYSKSYLLFFLYFWSGLAFAEPKIPVRLQLHYFHQFQFAGFYAAQILGLYDKAGLDVQFFEADPQLHPVKKILEGGAEFGLSDTELLVRRLKGEPVVVLGVVFQNTGYCLVSLNSSNIMSLRDLKGKRVALPEGRGSYVIRAMFNKQNFPMESLEIIDPKWDLQSLIDGDVDASKAYSTGELYRLRELELGFQVIHPIDYGINFYGDSLFTSERFLNEHPEAVENFRRASFEGWRYAFSHTEEMIDYILTLPSVKERKISRDRLRYEATALRHLILPDIIPLGSMSEARWTQMAKDLIPVNPEDDLNLSRLKGFIYRTPAESQRAFQEKASWIAGLVSVLLCLAIIWAFQLRSAVKRQTSDLFLAKRTAEARSEDAKQANASKTMFLANISHEFRTPLTSILGFSDIIQQTQLNEQQLKWVGIIHSRAEDLLALVNQTLDLIQTDAGDIPSKFSDFDLTQQLEDIASSFTPQFLNKKIDFIWSIDPEVTRQLRGPTLILRQILINLVGNALKFAPTSGRIELSCFAIKNEAEIGVGPQEISLQFTIIDNGPGIDAETAKHLFEPFSSSQPKHGQKGYGLGLAICKRLISSLNGEIWYTNLSAGGCAFHFTARFASQLNSSVNAEDQAEQKRILLVEDDAVNRELIRTYLKMSGFMTAEAESGQEAVHRCETERFDLIIMDIGLPDFDGIKVTEKVLRSGRSKNQKTPIIGLTASAVHKDRDRCISAGMVAYLTKPIDFESLILTIKATSYRLDT